MGLWIRRATRIVGGSAVALVLTLLICVPGNTVMLRKSLNELALESTQSVMGTVNGIRYETVGGHARTWITLDSGQAGKVEFFVSGGVRGDIVEWVSDTPTFAIGEKVVVLLHENNAGELTVTGGDQGKFRVTRGDQITKGGPSAQALLSAVAAIRAAVTTEKVDAPDPDTSFFQPQDAGIAAITCCGYLNHSDGIAVRWDSQAPNISYKVFANCADVTDESAAVQRAATSWTGITCSDATFAYAGAASVCSTTDDGENVLCWSDLGAGGPSATTTLYYDLIAPHNMRGFDIKFNSRYIWSTTCAASKMDVETIALHELGHVLTLVDQTSIGCFQYAMYKYPENVCKHDPSPDRNCLNGIYSNGASCDPVPVVTSISINNGANCASSLSVTLNNVCSGSPTQYMASEAADFAGASWQTYGTAPSFTLAAGDGNRTVYFKVKNGAGESAAISDTIQLDTTPPTGTITIAGGNNYTSTSTVTLTLSATDTGCGIYQMRFSNDNLGWGSWQAYGTTAPWTLSLNDGTKNVYVQYKDSAGGVSTGEIKDTITLDTIDPPAPVVTVAAAYQTDRTQLQASWTCSDGQNGSGISEYQYAIGLTPTDTGNYVVDWKSAGSNTEATETGLSLQYGQTLYWYVIATDNAGNLGANGHSAGVSIIEHSGMDVRHAKDLADGASVGMDIRAVAAIFGDGIYVQDPDRFNSIKVETEIPAGLATGNVVDVGGQLLTNSDKERYIRGSVALKVGSGRVGPLGINGRLLGGPSWHYDDVTGGGQIGIDGAVGGHNTIGLPVRMWGCITDSTSGAIQSWNLDTNPGWTLEGQWAYGVPTGGGATSCKDPTSGVTGNNVIGYNLSGDYGAGIAAPFYATSPLIDCSSCWNVHLKFWRWLGIEPPNSDYAVIEVSNNGTDWVYVWSNGTNFCDAAWSQPDFDITATAAGKSTVRVRFGMGPTDANGPRPGWNLDDIEVIGKGYTCTLSDGYAESVRLSFGSGMQQPTTGSYVQVTGINSCYKDAEGKQRRMIRVTGWELIRPPSP